jgi:hypothetical protein
MTESCEATEQYLHLYQIAVEMADRVSARRATANAFFLTVDTALLAFLNTGLDNVFWLVSLTGIALSATWLTPLKIYRDLNAAKYKVTTKRNGCKGALGAGRSATWLQEAV